MNAACGSDYRIAMARGAEVYAVMKVIKAWSTEAPHPPHGVG